MALVPNIRYFRVSHHLSTSSITSMSILTCTFCFTPADDLTRNKPTLPSTHLLINCFQGTFVGVYFLGKLISSSKCSGIRYDAKFIRYDAKFIRYDAKFIRYDAKFIRYDAKFIRYDAKFIRYDAKFIRYDAKFIRYDAKFIRYDAKFIRYDAKFIRYDAKFIRYDAKFIRYDAKFIRYDAKFMMQRFIFNHAKVSTFSCMLTTTVSL